jgi:uncharacterized membrane protein YeaQ/YmgE (transglycosylase-associated protein family)
LLGQGNGRGAGKPARRIAKGGEEIMGIIAWIVFGLLAGWLAKLVMPGKDPGGCIITMLLGVAGAVLGGFLGTMLGFGGIEGFDLRSFLMAVVGAILLLLLYRVFTGRRSTTRRL